MSDPNYYFITKITNLISDLDPQELQKIYRITHSLVLYRNQKPKLLDETQRFVYERTQSDASTEDLKRQ